MRVQSILFEKTPLLRLARFIGNSESIARISNRRISDTQVEIILIEKSKEKALYAASGGKLHKVNIEESSAPLSICFMTPAKGNGFVSIGQGWSFPLFYFGEGYGSQQMEEARRVGKELESILGYPLKEISYGADA